MMYIIFITMPKLVIIKRCSLCNTRLGFYKNEKGEEKWNMLCVIDSMLTEGFVPYNVCGICAMNRKAQKEFERKREN